MQGECEYDKCSHLEPHAEGFCWRITNKDFEFQANEEKYCQCGVPENVRLFITLGYMTVRMNDTFITKFCDTCKETVLLLLNETTCHHCKIIPR